MFFSITAILFFLPSLTYAILIDTCNCSQPIEKGTIDLSDPHYCTHPEPVKLTKEVSYKLHTRSKDPITWSGFSCDQWISQKTITTNSLFSHDTTFKKAALKVGAEECWATVRYPQTCDGNPMQKDGRTFRHLREPEGDGYWMTEQVYKTKNCVSQEIQLAKECHDCPVTSPFGILTNDSRDEYAHHNDLTIVWKLPESKDPICDVKIFFEGTGSLTTSLKTGKLDDRTAQLEFLFENNVNKICSEALVYPVLGLPSTYLEIIETPARVKHHLRRLDQEPLIFCSFMPASNAETCLAFIGPTIAVEACAQVTNPVDTAFEVATTLDQNFQIWEDGRIQKVASRDYISEILSTEISLVQCHQINEPLNESTIDQWIFNTDIKTRPTDAFHIIQGKSNKCLSFHIPHVTLQTCNASDIDQQWFFIENDQETEFQELVGKGETVISNPSRAEKTATVYENSILHHGFMRPRNRTEYCFSVPRDGKNNLQLCPAPGEKIPEFPKQEFVYVSNGFLKIKRVRIASSQVIPFNARLVVKTIHSTGITILALI